jgi:hypothetical protein
MSLSVATGKAHDHAAKPPTTNLPQDTKLAPKRPGTFLRKNGIDPPWCEVCHRQASIWFARASLLLFVSAILVLGVKRLHP